MNVEWFVLFG